MLYAAFSGGLGNQLFIACYALRLKYDCGQSVKLCTHHYHSTSTRGLYFNTILKPLADLVWDGTPALDAIKCFQTLTDVDPTLHKPDESAFLNGYFQKWALIAPYVHTYKKTLNLCRRFPVQKMDNTIGLHFRIGDYMKAPFNTVYHIMAATYYINAVKHLLDKDSYTNIRIFCEPQDWATHVAPVADQLKQTYPSLEVVRSSCDTDWEDFYHMAHCGAIVIANSSFSYWSALLGNPHHVVRPTVWWTPEFQANPPKHIVADSPDVICPPYWIPVSE